MTATLRRCMIALAMASALFAPANAQQTPSITARETLTAEDGNARILRGEVVVDLGGIRFEADEVVQHLRGGGVIRYEATGKPVTLTHEVDGLRGRVRVTAEKMVYLVESKTILLTNYELKHSNGSTQRGKKFKVVLE